MPQRHTPERASRIYLSSHLILAALIVCLGIFFLKREKSVFVQTASEHLGAIAEFKVKEIQRWRRDLLEDANTISKAPQVIRGARQLITGNTGDSDGQDLVYWLEYLRSSHQLSSISLFDPQGNLCLTLPDQPEKPPQLNPGELERVLPRQTAWLSDLQYAPGESEPHFDLLAPLIFEPELNRLPDQPPPSKPSGMPEPGAPVNAFGVIAIRLSPNHFFRSQQWPTPSQTAETLLVRAEGGEVVVLNQLRHHTNAMLDFRLPFSDPNPPSVQAASGFAGTCRERDYRGVPVVAAVRPVPETPWHLVAKIDRAEVFGPLYARLSLILSLIVVLVLATGLGLRVWQRRRELEWTQAEAQRERERSRAVERLLQISRAVNDVILVVDEDLRILEFNDRTSEVYGYSEEEFRQLTLHDLRFSEEEAKNLVAWERVQQDGEAIFEIRHRRRDGSPLFFEVSARRLEIDGRVCYQGILRDISTRNEAARALRESQRQLATLLSNLPGMAYRCRNDRQWTMLYVSQGVVELTGYAAADLVKNHRVAFASLIHDDDRELVWQQIQQAIQERKTYNLTYRIKSAAGEEKWLWERGRTVGSADGQLELLEGFISDITVQKRNEDQLKIFSQAVEQNPASIVITDPQGNIEYVNSKFTRLTGYALKEVLGQNPRILKSGEIAAPGYQKMWKSITQGREWRGEFHNKKKNGQLYWESASISPVIDDAGRITHFLAVKENITQRKKITEAIRESQKQLRVVVQTASDAIIGADAQGRIIFWNRSAERIFGYASKDILGQPMNVLIPESCRNAHPKVFSGDVKAGQFRLGGRTVELSGITRAGKEFPMEVSVVQWKSARGIHCTAIMRDISERKQAEAALRDSEQHFRSIYEQAPVAYHSLDHEARLADVNQSWLQMLGFTRHEVIGKCFADFLIREQAPLFHEQFAQFKQAGQIRGAEFDLVARDGSIVSISAEGRISHLPNSTLLLTHCILHNITERKRAEAAIRESEHQLKLALDAADMGTWDWEIATGWITWGGHHARLVGLKPEEFDGTYECFARCVHPEDLQGLQEALDGARNQHTPYAHEFRVVWPDGSVHWIASKGTYYYDGQDQPLRMCGAISDTTQRKSRELEHIALQAQLNQAQKLESIGRLAAGIAHEINTPTQYIGDNTRFLQEAFGDLSRLWTLYGRLTETARRVPVPAELVQEIETTANEVDVEYLFDEVPRAIEQTLEGVSRVTQIVRAMKDFSHPGSESKTAIQLNRAIESTVTVARNEWKYVADLDLDFEASPPPVPCLPGEFNQVILNLIINAAHAIGEKVGDREDAKGKITIRTRQQGEWMEIRIQDTGAGIPEKIRSQIYDPFFTTKPVGKGTGQGLAIARSVIVDKHGGTLDCESEIGQGATFIIRLPLDKTTDSIQEQAA